ncbi:6-pyruvoyl-tetrahydropterin synthase-related protein [Lactococcus cremoris]|uniref:Uncharacterized protein n=4 Tax=Lactococcus lactis subsp. cremoris TaxID=1359 RepID=A0A2A5SVM2_LACLC|nr:6-pyruvoyl-tetrahydropterin synthase-related protein [Lactococcus cremoris]PCS19936.1 hypothetical protein RU92_GL001454 [Lactococcus cremoris subsp. tructae]
MERLEKRGQGLENFKKYNFVFYIIILFITILATFPFYRGNFHAGNDFAFNYARVMSTISALKDGQIIPQFDPNALSGFGYAWNEFYGPLPTYFISVIKFIVRSWSLSFALFYSLCLFISGVLIFNFSSFLLKDHTNSKLFGLLAVALFTFSNSTYINLYYYANPSQPLALLFVILLFWGMTKMFNKRSFAAFLMVAFGAAGLPLSHTVTTICTLPFVLLYLLFLIIKKGNLKENIKIIGLGFLSVTSAIGLSAFFLFPLLENLKSGIYNVSNSDFSRSFGWNNIAYFQGKWEPLYKIEFSYYKFPSLLFVFIVLFIFIFSLINFKKTNAKYSLIFSCFSLVLVLMQLPIFPWKLFSVFTIVQDPARFSTLFGLFSALSLVLILPILLDKISGKTSYYLTISLLVIFSILGFTEFRNRIQKGSQPLFASAQSLLNKTPFNYMENPDSIAIGEYLPQVIGSHNQPYEKTIQQFYKDKNVYGMRNQAMTYLSQRGKLPEGLAKSIQISDYSKKGSHVTFTATTGSKSASVEIPEIYYKGFIAFTKEGNKKIKLTSQISKNGFLEIKVPAKFSGKIYSYFAMSSATKYGGLLSLLTFVSLLIILITKTFIKRKLSKDK